MDVIFLVNKASSTSIPVELGIKIDETTEVDVSIVSFYDQSIRDVDPDVAASDTDIYTLGASDRFDIAAYRQLRTLLYDCDVLHTHHNSVGSIGRAAAIGTGTKVVNTEHNDHRHFTHTQNLVNCLTYPLADTVVANSQSTQNSFQFYELPFLSLSESKMIHNGVDFERIDMSLSRDDIPELPEGKKIVTAATMTQQKNLTILVEAMEMVIESSPEAEFIIIGDGPLRTQIERRVRELSIDTSTTFLGYLPERELVYATIAKCDIFVVPSLYEGFCNAAVEAMGCGLPIVASDIDVFHEVVADGGRFVDPHNPEEIAAEISKLIQNNNERQALANTAQQRARQTFPIKKNVDRYLGVYYSIVS